VTGDVAARGASWVAVTALGLLLGGLLALPGVAAAQPPAGAGAGEAVGFGATAEVPAPEPRRSADDATATVSTVRPGETPLPRETVPDLLREVPGTRGLDAGGVGAFAGLSLRGAALDQNATYLGALRLDGPDTGSFDLSTVPAAALDAIEVGRGPAPAWWNEGAIGGVLLLHPAEQVEPTLTLYGGSFGLWGLRGTAGVAPSPGERGPRLLTTTTIEGARNDFTFRDDNLTPFNPEDDRTRRRRNADVQDASTLWHARVPAGDGEVDAVVLGFLRSGGVPGPGGGDTLEARRAVRRVQGSIGHTQPLGDGSDPGRFQLAAAGGVEERVLDDRLAELGMGGPHRYEDRFSSALGRAALELPLTPWLGTTVVGTYRFEGFAPHDALATTELRARSRRHSFAGTVEGRVHGDVAGLPAELRASVRVLSSQVRAGDAAGAQGPADGHTLAPTGRVGMAVNPAPGWSLTLSAGNGVRLPTALELFGNRVLLLGDPELEPERATTVDVGVSGRGRRGPVRGSMAIRGFARLGQDAIVYSRSTGRALRPENVGRTRTLGVEAEGRLGVGPHLWLVTALTAMDAREVELDRTLPFRPRIVGYARLEGWARGVGPLDEVRPYAEVEGVGSVETNLANLRSLPGRAPVAVGVRTVWVGGRVEAAAAFRDVFDVRGTDLLGFPLPGRRFEAALTLRPGKRP